VLDPSVDSPEILGWLSDTEAAIRHLFPMEEERLSRFRSVFANVNPTDHPGAHDRLHKAHALIDSMIESIQHYWPDNEQILEQKHQTGGNEMNVQPKADPRKVFVVHGRNGAARRAMFEFLRTIGVNPLEWSQIVAATGKASPYIGEVLDQGFLMAQAVVVLWTPDDEARLKEEFRKSDDPPHEFQLTGQARPNVLFEAGMAMALHPTRTVLVELGRLRPFTDVLGRHTVKLDGSVASRQELANRLKTAGCHVNLDGTDWHTTGSFDLPSSAPPPAQPKQAVSEMEPSEIEMLKLFAGFGSNGAQKDSLAKRLNLSELKIDRLLDRLTGRGFLQNLMRFDEPTSWYRLAPEGRDYLVERDLL